VALAGYEHYDWQQYLANKIGMKGGLYRKQKTVRRARTKVRKRRTMIKWPLRFGGEEDNNGG